MKVIVFLAEGFEEVEALTVVDYLRRVDIGVDMVAIGETREVKGAHGIVVISDMLLEYIDKAEAYDGVIIPGGLPGATNLRDNPMVTDLVAKFNEDSKLTAAICAGPIVLEKAVILKDRRITSYPGFEGDFKEAKYETSPVVIDKNIITSRGPYYAVDFAIEIVRYLLGDEKAESLKGDILYNILI